MVIDQIGECLTMYTEVVADGSTVWTLPAVFLLGGWE